MTSPRDPATLLAAYLDEGMTMLPDRVADAVMVEIHGTRQRAAFGRRGSQFTSRLSLAAAALVAMLALGAVLFIVVGGPRPTPSEEPRATVPGGLTPTSTPSGPSTAPTGLPVSDPAGMWVATGTMGTPRSGHNSVRLLDGRVLVVGGSVPDDSEADRQRELTSAELYDPVTGTWSRTADMLQPNDGFPARLLPDGKVLVGGQDGGAQVYDPATETWAETGPMVMCCGSTATVLRDGRVLVIGYDDTGELYDPASGTWTATDPMTTPRRSHTAVVMADGRVLVAGGHAPGDDPTDSVELYDPETDTWTAIAGMDAEREQIEAFLRADGTVLVIGSSRGDPLSAASFHPATGTWTVLGGSTAKSSYQTATSLADGRVLMAGGGGGVSADEFLDAELYDPDAEAWSPAAPMLRSHGTPATLLLDGTVLVAGGADCLDNMCVATGSAELYVPAGVSPPPLQAFPSWPPPVIPTPTPRPTPYPPQTGPEPEGARTWTVTVVNDSPEPLILLMAEDGADGMGPLCGSMTPNVVAPRTSESVTFRLPPKDVTGCAIWVNAVPGDGGSLVATSDAPIPGEIWVTADGQVGWLSP